jgi:hypothetical protein
LIGIVLAAVVVARRLREIVMAGVARLGMPELIAHVQVGASFMP